MFQVLPLTVCALCAMLPKLSKQNSVVPDELAVDYAKSVGGKH
jgi:hypothetical protein